jgi:hypothetical protein
MSKGDLKGAVQFPAKGAQNTSREAGLSELVQMARQAFEERRRKQSLVLATAILKIDPENREALVIQSWVSEDLKKDLDSAAIQVEEARRENALGLWDRAERLVRGTLAVDPDNEEAKKLLAEVIPARRHSVFAYGSQSARVRQTPRGCLDWHSGRCRSRVGICTPETCRKR